MRPIVIAVSAVSLLAMNSVMGQHKFLAGIDAGAEIAWSVSHLSYNFKRNFDQRVTTEVRVGIAAQRYLNPNFAIQSAALVGVKPKTNAYNIGTPAHGAPNLSFLRMADETFSARDHYFAEVPVTLVYHFRKVQISGGLLTRYYFKKASSSDADFLNGRYETGLYTKMSFKLWRRFNLNFEVYRGMTPILKHTPQAPSPSLTVWNNFTGLGLGYNFHGARTNRKAIAL
jgi:hypothetical protein